MTFSVHEAKTQLSKLLDLVQDGEEIFIHRHGKPIARLTSIASPPTAPLGAMRGEFEIQEGWDRALTDEEADAFWEGKW
jgi:prevent-host-death family protein